MSLDQEIQAATGAARLRRKQLEIAIRQLTQRTRVARRLFCDAQGQVTADAANFFAEIARQAGMNRRGFVTDPRLRDYRDGAQDLVRIIIDSLALDGRRLEHLRQQLHSIDAKG